MASQLVRAVLSSRFLLALALVGYLTVATGASAQPQPGRAEEVVKRPPDPLILIEEPQLLVERLIEKGVTGRSLAETLRFILSAQPGLKAHLVGEGRVLSENRIFRLTSSLRTFGNAGVWSGEMTANEADAKPRLIGPVTMVDDAGLKPNAMNEIAALIQSHVRRPSQGGTRAIALSFCSVPPVGSTALAASILEDFASRLRGRVESVGGVHWDAGSPADKCRAAPNSPEGNTAVLTGQIEVRDGRDGRLVITPTLSWPAISALPLPSYTGTLAPYAGGEREEYVGLTGRAIGALLTNEYPIKDIHDAIDTAKLVDSEAARKGSSLLEAGHTYLALPLLQRGAGGRPPNIDILNNLGIAYRIASAPRQAEKTFQQIVKIDPKNGRAHKELGIILFNERKYKEAAREFELAGTTPGALEKYALVLYLLDDLQGARVKAEAAVKAGENTLDLTLLLARLDIGEKKFGSALTHLKAGFGTNVRPAYISALRTLARAAASQKDYSTADEALELLTSQAPSADNFLIYGRQTLARAEEKGFGDHAKRAAELFRKASTAPRGNPEENPQLSAVALELAEALFVSGEWARARDAATQFLFADATSDPNKTNIVTKGYVPVAKLIMIASEYLYGDLKESPSQILDRDLAAPLGPAELYVVVPRSSGSPLSINIAKWGFRTFDKYVCTQLAPTQQDVLISLSTSVQKKVGREVSEGCDRTRN